MASISIHNPSVRVHGRPGIELRRHYSRRGADLEPSANCQQSLAGNGGANREGCAKLSEMFPLIVLTYD